MPCCATGDGHGERSHSSGRPAAPDFSEAEIELVAALAPDIAAAVRRTLLVSEIAHRDAEEGPGWRCCGSTA